MSVWDSMQSYLKDVAVDTGHHMINLAMVVVGLNHPSWLTSTLLHFSEKDVGMLDMTSLMFPVVLTRLHDDDDDDEQHSLHCLASELPSNIETDELLSLSLASLVCFVPSAATLQLDIFRDADLI